jgi:hypothetical protein
MFKKKEFIQNALIGLILLVAPTAVVVTYAVPYSHMGGNMEKGLSYGTISSIQQSEHPESPAWILSGHWATNLINKTKSDFNQSNPAKFDATFTMVMLNGSARHQHHISNFSLTDMKTASDTMAYSGLVTVTMKKGPVANVPIEIKVINNNVISIWFDPAKVEKHFGESPIYGTVFNKKDMESKGSMAQNKNMTI